MFDVFCLSHNVTCLSALFSVLLCLFVSLCISLDAVPVCRVSHDGQLLLGSCDDDVLRLIDRNNGDILNEYKGHHNIQESKIDCLFDNNDTNIITGSYDGKIITYDLVDGTCTHDFTAHEKAITSICHHPNKSILATASLDQHIKLWES